MVLLMDRLMLYIFTITMYFVSSLNFSLSSLVEAEYDVYNRGNVRGTSMSRVSE